MLNGKKIRVLLIQLPFSIYSVICFPRLVRAYNEFFPREKYDKRTKIHFIEVDTRGNEFLPLFTVLSISLIKQLPVSPHNLHVLFVSLPFQFSICLCCQPCHWRATCTDSHACLFLSLWTLHSSLFSSQSNPPTVILFFYKHIDRYIPRFF